MRFFPAVLKLKELIANDTIGDVHLVQAILGKQSLKRHSDPKLG